MNKLRGELCAWVTDFSDCIAISYRKDDDVVDVSFRELVSSIFALEKRLRKDSGERVAIIGENSFQWFCYFYASLLAGKQTLVCDMLLPLNEMSDVLRIMNVEKVFLSPELSGLDAELKSVNEALDVEFFKEERVEITDDADCEYEEGKILCTTSGTTAKAKGVVIGTEAFVNNNICLSQVMEGETGDCVYSPLPMHHMYGVNKTFAFLHKGARVCLGSMRRIEKDIEVFNPDRMLLVPTAVEFLYKRNRLDSRFKSIVVSGCKCEKRVEELCKKQGVFLQNIYGSSESAGGMALNVRGNAIDELSVIPGREVEIASDGEILIKTPWLMDGYYHNQEATDKKISAGVLFTEDMGYVDAEGLLHINGRKKDMISMEKGDKIYCEETDEILSSLHGVKEAAVLYENKKLVAVICPEKGISKEEILGEIELYNRTQQVIRRIGDVWIRKEALPRTVTGKMKRTELEKQYSVVGR